MSVSLAYQEEEQNIISSIRAASELLSRLEKSINRWRRYYEIVIIYFKFKHIISAIDRFEKEFCIDCDQTCGKEIYSTIEEHTPRLYRAIELQREKDVPEFFVNLQERIADDLDDRLENYLIANEPGVREAAKELHFLLQA